MGSAASKPATTTTPAQSTLTSERLDEKRSMAIQQTAHALANTHQSGINPTVVAGLTMNKLDAWQSDFDAVSHQLSPLTTPLNPMQHPLILSSDHDSLHTQIEPNLEIIPTGLDQRRP